jgi:hypothetical protein
MDKEKFFPKYKKDKLVKKYLLNDLKKNSLINRDICHKCETKRVNVCRCKLEESLCEKDHNGIFAWNIALELIENMIVKIHVVVM